MDWVECVDRAVGGTEGDMVIELWDEVGRVGEGVTFNLVELQD